MYRRRLCDQIHVAMTDTPVIFIKGARQTGKTTLTRQLEHAGNPIPYLTFDDVSVLSAAQSDPPGFLAAVPNPVILDEVQRLPELFVSIKAVVDRARTAGRFILTGSADVMLAPNLSESLAGRMEQLTLWPLSQGEIGETRETFVDTILGSGRFKPPPRETRLNLMVRISQGGYPVAISRNSEPRRRAWFDSYISSIIQRDVRDLSGISDLTALPRLLQLLAARSANLVNFAGLSRDSGLPQTTLKRYFSLLEITFLVVTIQPWSNNRGQRLVKAPKVYLNDTGLLVSLLDITPARLNQDPNAFGALLENFVAMELRKQASWSDAKPGLLHYRTHTGAEVDLVLETGRGEIAGIEVKSSMSVSEADFRGLKSLAEVAGPKFRRGVVLYTGEQIIPFGKNLAAVPVQALWN